MLCSILPSNPRNRYPLATVAFDSSFKVTSEPREMLVTLKYVFESQSHVYVTPEDETSRICTQVPFSSASLMSKMYISTRLPFDVMSHVTNSFPVARGPGYSCDSRYSGRSLSVVKDPEAMGKIRDSTSKIERP